MLQPDSLSQNLLIALLCALALLVAAISPVSTPAQARETVFPPPREAAESQAQIDRLLKECDDLFSKAMFDELASKADQALKLSAEIHDQNRSALALNQLGTADFLRGRMKDAREAQQRAAVLAAEAGNKRLQAKSLSSIGTILRAQGEFEDAIEFYRRARNLSREIGDSMTEWLPMRNTGILYSEMGDFETAEPILQDALRLARALRNKAYEEATLISLLMLEERRQNFAAALKYSEQAFAVNAAANNLGLQIELIIDTATVYQDQGQHQKAIDLFQRALVIKQATGFHLDEPLTIALIGFSQKALGDFPAALDSLMRARSLIRQTGYSRFELVIDGGIAAIQRALGRNEEALQYYRQAVDIIEHLRTTAVQTDVSRASVIASRREVFVDAIDLLVSLKRENEALELAEHYHARVFLDQLVQARISLQKDMTSEQRQREDDLFSRLTLLQKQLFAPGISMSRETDLRKEILVAENDLDIFRAELRRSNPRYAETQYPALLSLDQIQKQLLQDDTVLIEYVLGQAKSFAWVISHQGITTVVLPSRAEIDAQVAAYRHVLTQKTSALTMRHALNDYDRESRRLYEMLVRPLEKSLSSSRRLIIVPDGVLSYVPFEALPVADARLSAGGWQASESQSTRNQRAEYLLERFSVTYAPSASALAAIKERRLPTDALRTKTLLAFGDPTYDARAVIGGQRSTREKSSHPIVDSLRERSFDFTNLPFTRAEVNAISALYGIDQRRIYLGDQAQEEAVKSEKLDEYRYLHFATHGMIDEKVPARSGIVLSLSRGSKEDGVLQMREIMRLKLNAELVTLSACGTGLGKLQDGEGITGLTRAFLHAGADSVVVSLWNVSDSGTAELMRGFYEQLNNGVPKDEALRQAKLRLLNGPQPVWRHPYFWAPFVLVGERERRNIIR